MYRDHIASMLFIANACIRPIRFHRKNNREFRDLPFTPANARPAVLFFNGDAYRGLKAETLSESPFDFLQNHLRILSGLYGVLRPLDLIQPYRLEMGSGISVPGKKDLYHFWSEKITEKIREVMTIQGFNAKLSKPNHPVFTREK
jgi:uncharacterized protein